jgi:hypothetical protein
MGVVVDFCYNIPMLHQASILCLTSRRLGLATLHPLLLLPLMLPTHMRKAGWGGNTNHSKGLRVGGSLFGMKTAGAP